MMRRAKLRSDVRGASAIEFAIAAPLFVLAMFGLFRVGILFLANAGMQHAVGEGARYASIYPAPSDAQIIEKVHNSRFGMDSDNIASLTVTRGVNTGTKYAELEMRYSVPMDFVIYQGDPVILEHSRRAYVP